MKPSFTVKPYLSRSFLSILQQQHDEMSTILLQHLHIRCLWASVWPSYLALWSLLLCLSLMISSCFSRNSRFLYMVARLIFGSRGFTISKISSAVGCV